MRFVSILAALALAAPALAAEDPTDGLMVSAIDKTIDPCQDFYRHACSGWLKANPIPADRSEWDVSSPLDERNKVILRKILEDQAAHPDDDEGRKLGDYWTACMDSAAIEGAGLAPLKESLDAIDDLPGLEALPALVARLHLAGVGVLFGFGSDQDYHDATQTIAEADQGGLGLPERKYYLARDADSASTRAAYVKHMAAMLSFAGMEDKAATKAAQNILKFETRLAQVSMADVARRDPVALYHKMARSELDRLTPGFAWKSYLSELGAPSFESLNVVAPSFFEGLATVLRETPLADLKLYLRMHLLDAYAGMLPEKFTLERFDFFDRQLQGTKQIMPRWKRCVAAADGDIGEALGKRYVAEVFPPEAKARIVTLLDRIRAAYAEDIAHLDWMSDATRQKALAKLDLMSSKIGYPDTWRDYGALAIKRDDALGNRMRAARFESARELAKIGQPVDRGEWSMTPPTINAYYDSQKNDINFPAGILQPPNFDPKWDDAVNYGAIGATMGHEMTHGFDDEGRKFDGKGNLADWWTKADAKAFHTRAACLAKEYSGFTVAPGVNLDGKLTLGENTADNGGTRLALMAFEKLIDGKPAELRDGYTPRQRYFLAYAQSWCTNQTPEADRLQALSDPHATAEFRVNGVVANMPEFAEAFACKAGTPMAPVKRCRVW